MSKCPKTVSKYLEIELWLACLKKAFLNPLGQKFLQRELESMSEIYTLYSSYREAKSR